MSLQAALIAASRQPVIAPPSEEPIHLRRGPITIDRIRRIVQVDDRTVDLIPREYALLDHFLQHPGIVFTRSDLQKDVFGYAPTARTNTIDVHIGHLRRKLAAAAGWEMFRTIRGIGYVFCAGLSE